MAAAGALRQGQERPGRALRVEPWQPYAIVIGLALVPPFIMMLYFRSRERVGREPLRVVLLTFMFGGTAGVAMAVLLHHVFEIGFASPQNHWGLGANFVAIVIAAPLVEEFSKGMVLGFVRPQIKELEDGLVYGAAVGLGFAATENLLYGMDALGQYGFELATWTVSLRIFSSMLLHLAASGLLGFGYAYMTLKRLPFPTLLPYYLLAIALHATYNFLVTVDNVGYFALGAALIMVSFIVALLKDRIERLDALPHLR